jgi:SAM-dependent methyltransferase
VNALSQIHRAVRPGGVLLDLHPTRPFATLEAGGVRLGSIDEREFMRIVEATEAGLATTVRRGLFAPEEALRFDVIERFDTADELVEKVDGWEGVRVPTRLARRVRAGEPPFDVRERVVLQRFRVR